MGVEQSTVYKCLEKKTVIMGFEVIDLFVLCITLCFLNLIFSESAFKIFFTFGPVSFLALGLRLMKTGKAENYLVHWFKFQLSPGIFRAWPLATKTNLFLQMRQKGTIRYAGFHSG